MKLTDFKTKSAWTIGILAIISLWIAFPLIFKYWVFKLLVTPPFTTENFASLGPIGDIYGSLTALFTSATLIVVLYSAYLQREANKDTRQAMADQLQHARDATATQLKQARKAVDDQLTQARDATVQQLTLVQATHDAQIIESKYAVFSSMFNILLNQKKTVLDSIYTGKEEFKPKVIFETLGLEFEHLIANNWKDLNHEVKKVEDMIFNQFLVSMDENMEKSFSFNELTSYFYMYIPLLLLIKNSSLKKEDKKIYFMVLSHSMTHDEQVTLLWFLIFSGDIKEALKDTQLIDTKFDINQMEFIMNNFHKSYFSHPEVLEHWNNHTNNKTPA